MSKRTSFQRLMIAVFAAFLLSLFLETAHADSRTNPAYGRPDIIEIDLPAIPGGDQMPGVQFLHDLHTEQIKGNDCSVCHLKKENSFVFKFKRIQDTDTKTDMAVYHDNCMGCHIEKKSAGSKSGPITGECRACHSVKPTAASTRQDIPFTKSLHYRHEASKSIIPLEGQDADNCSACHHKYNEETKKTVYKKGEEESCLYCHKTLPDNDISSARVASHNSCVLCHQKVAERFKDAGPVNCKGCHSLEEQNKIKVVDNVPRLKRNQPDMVLLTGWTMPQNSPEAMKKAIETSMKPVAFNHKSHELRPVNCRVCHHDTLKPCQECHTDTGKKEGGFVRLEQAMHNINSDKTCMGCHRSNQTQPECAGCHFLMPAKDFGNSSCETCHNADASIADFSVMDKKAMAALAGSTAKKLSDSFKPVAQESIPETIVIGSIADKYEPAQFPHGKIIKAIKKGLKENSMAAVFHGDGVTLCMGCHHNAPATEKPQNCGSCHGKRNSAGETRPDLLGAYHGQCITCHEKMEMDLVAATDCIKCHREKK